MILTPVPGVHGRIVSKVGAGSGVGSSFGSRVQGRRLRHGSVRRRCAIDACQAPSHVLRSGATSYALSSLGLEPLELRCLAVIGTWRVACCLASRDCVTNAPSSREVDGHAPGVFAAQRRFLPNHDLPAGLHGSNSFYYPC